MKKICFFILLLIMASFLWKDNVMTLQAQEKIPVGKQILCDIELPASTSFWNGKIADLGIDRPLHKTEKEKINYWLFIPKDNRAKTDKGFPLLLFLHGAGEVGPDPTKVKMHGPTKLVETRQAEHWPFITLSPQAPGGKYWSPAQLLLLLDAVEAKYPVDKSRVYVTGLSMGGFGTWMLIKRAPERFAAAAPVCGGGDTTNMDKIINIPIAVFHGDADSAVDPQYSRDLVAAYRKAGGKNIDLTMYMNVNHDSWTQTYNNPKFYEWLLQQKK